MKKQILSTLAIAAIFSACSHSEKKSEQTQAPAPRSVSDSINTPESAYYDPETKTIFVSNVAGEPGKKDGVGWITQLSLDGKVLKKEVVKGLNAPKGLRAVNGTLWVSDIDRVVAIDPAKDKIVKSIKIKGAKFLNDTAVGPKGEIYVSDMVTDKIHVIRDGKAKVFASGSDLEHPNGLLIVGDKLVVAGWGKGMKADFSTDVPGHLYSLDLKTKKKTLITPEPLGHLDGLERRADGTYLVSDWMSGKVYSVTADGKATVLFDEKGHNTADIGWIEDSKTLLIPLMDHNQVEFRELK